MLRWTIAGVIVIGLLAGIWLLWPRDEGGSSPTTVPVAAETTTTSEGTTTTELTTTTVDPTQVREVETVGQAEAILRELWFGWFEGIYNQNEDRIREVVATEEQVETGKEAFGAPFTAEPAAAGVMFESVEILRTENDCFVAFVTLDVTSFRGPDAVSEFVTVQRWVEESWHLMSTWQHRDDLWEADCDATLSDLP